MKKVKFDQNGENGLCYIPAIAEVGLAAIEDETMRPVGIMFELLDTRDFDDNPDETYPYLVSASIMLDNVNPAFDESNGAGSADRIREDAYQYCGGVPVDHILQDEVTISGKPALFSQFTLDEAKKVTVKHDCGTIAAQQGKGAEYTFLQFADEQSAEKYANILLTRAPGMAITIGFILDRPINMAGHDGWSTLQDHLNGPTIYAKGK